MANYFANLPAAQMPRNAMLDVSGVNAGLDTIRDQKNENRNAMMRQQQMDAVAEERTYQRGRDAKDDAWQQVQRAGQAADAIQRMADTDPAKQAAWGQYLKDYGDGDHSPEELDFRTGPKIAAAAAGKFLDPREAEATALDMQYKRAQINALNAKASNVGAPTENARAMTRGAPNGHMWNDPNNPAAGVSKIPGFEQTIPGEVAGKVAMMNMARDRIKNTRTVLERDWGAKDLAQWTAANVPLVGDVAAASGDVGIAQRDVRTAIEAALRTMTGAAAPEQEVTRYERMFLPGPQDTKESAKQKLDGLLNFMDEAERLVMQGRGDAPSSAPPAAAATTPQQPAAARPRAVHEQTGEAIEWDGQNWVKIGP